MKLRWRILYILLGSLFLLPSCTDEDLDTTMYGGREDTEFYNNLEEINQALTACYFYMKDSWNDMSLELMFVHPTIARKEVVALLTKGIFISWKHSIYLRRTVK